MAFCRTLKFMEKFPEGFYHFYSKHYHREYPNWMLRHFDDLSCGEQVAYYKQFERLTNKLQSEALLVEQLKWILKSYPDELAYGLYIQIALGSCESTTPCVPQSVMAEWERLYGERFNQSYLQPMMVEEEALSAGLASGQQYQLDESEDELPF